MIYQSIDYNTFQYIQSLHNSAFHGPLLQNGNWADRVCEEKHGSICMKMSASELTGEEVLQDVGCKTVRCV